ncbi:MAG TPA: hypothetical protein VE935_01360, partial [Burkholderiales bacterium]|nr:hypothetical protein [Burkholderiales bacterium]
MALKINLNTLVDEIRRTNWKDPGTWGGAPKALVLIAILVAIPVVGYLFDTSSQIEDLERLHNTEQTLKQ